MPAPFAVIAAAAAVAQGAKTIGRMNAAKNAERAAGRQAAILDQQADEILRRAEENVKRVEAAGRRVRGQQTAAFAKAGVQLGFGDTLTALEDTSREVADSVETIRREAEFDANMLRLNGETIRKNAKHRLNAQRTAILGDAAISAIQLYAGAPGLKGLSSNEEAFEKGQEKGREKSIKAMKDAGFDDDFIKSTDDLYKEFRASGRTLDEFLKLKEQNAPGRKIKVDTGFVPRFGPRPLKPPRVKKIRR